ncbi:MAG: hypothetical protein LBJ13_01990, partial [Puniceicoccales bacterium]|nr:hypothetical protein [Puniceicoccales bacterium]
MSAIGGGHGNISDELLALQSEVGKLCNEARSNRGVAKFGTHTINGVTYNIEVIKTGLFRPTKVTIKSKLKDRAVVKGNARKFSTSKQGDVRKHLRHAVLKNQWKAKGNFSMEQKAQLYSEARGHGTKKGSVDLEKFTSECLEMAKGAGNSITQRGEALLSLCIVNSNISAQERDTNRPLTNLFAEYGDNGKVVPEIVDGLLDAMKDPKLPKADREKAGELLEKIYNDPNIPQSEKDKIAANVRNTVKSIACNMAAISSGAPPEVIEQLITGWGDKLPEGVIPQIKDPIANKMPWPGRVMYKPFTMEPDTKSAQDKRLTLDDSGRVQNDQKECALAGILGGPIGHVTSNGITVSGEIHEKTVYHDGQSYTAFLIFNHNNPNLPPTVIMDLDAFHSNGLGSLAHRLNTEIDTGLNDVEQAAFKTATDEDRAKLEKIKK